jgi:hypothetical protein
VLEDAGYVVVEVDPPGVAETTELWLYLVGAELRTLLIPGIEPLLGTDARAFLDLFLAPLPVADLEGYMGALAVAIPTPATGASFSPNTTWSWGR